MEKALLIGVTYDTYPTHGVKAKHLHYAYRGHEYIITRMNNGYMESPLWYEHQREQKAIDETIANENKPIPKQDKYEGTGQEGFDIFWEYVNE